MTLWRCWVSLHLSILIDKKSGNNKTFLRALLWCRVVSNNAWETLRAVAVMEASELIQQDL